MSYQATPRNPINRSAGAMNTYACKRSMTGICESWDRYETSEAECEWIVETKGKSQYCTDRDSASPRIQPEPGPPPFHACIIPPSPAYAYTSAGGTEGQHWHSGKCVFLAEVSEDVSVVVGVMFSVGVGENSDAELSGVSIREPCVLGGMVVLKGSIGTAENDKA
jgi:hypothetical protein